MKSWTWMKWALSESGAKSVSRVIQKKLGEIAETLDGAILITCVHGIMQVVSGFLFSRHAKKSVLNVTLKQILLCVAFGTVASAMSTIGTIIFLSPGKDVGVVTILASLGIIPSVLIDRIFGERLARHQWIGIGLFIVSGYFILDFPGLSILLQPPAWVLLALLLSGLAVMNETITNAQSKIKPDKVNAIHPMVNNFWIGVTTVIVCGLLLAFLESFGQIKSLVPMLWVLALFQGVIVSAMICFKLITYGRGGTIALKKLVMQGGYVVITITLGIVVYDEAINLGKILGTIGYLVAFSCVDRDTWAFLTKKR